MLDDGLALANSVAGWYVGLRKHLEDFKPETKSIGINFSRSTSNVGFAITVPDGWRKRNKKIKIPLLPDYRIASTLDEGFTEVGAAWRKDGGHFVLDASELPSSERFLVTMEGRVDRKVLGKLIYTKHATSSDNDEQNDKYWLESSIRNPGQLEKTYSDLEIDDVNFGVTVSIDRMFGLSIPAEISDKIDAHKRLLESANRMDRNNLFRAAQQFRRAQREIPTVDVDNFTRLVGKMTAKSLIRNYISVERPYGLGEIGGPERYVGLIPQDITVEAVTRLTLRSPVARGVLVFKREAYLKDLREAFKSMTGGSEPRRHDRHS